MVLPYFPLHFIRCRVLRIFFYLRNHFLVGDSRCTQKRVYLFPSYYSTPRAEVFARRLSRRRDLHLPWYTHHRPYLLDPDIHKAHAGQNGCGEGPVSTTLGYI